MPDANKFSKLNEIGYKVHGCCAMCVHSDLNQLTGWGTCRVHCYDHLKHDNPPGGRGVSIHAMGSCPSFSFNPTKAARLGITGEYTRFIP